LTAITGTVGDAIADDISDSDIGDSSRSDGSCGDSSRGDGCRGDNSLGDGCSGDSCRGDDDADWCEAGDNESCGLAAACCDDDAGADNVSGGWGWGGEAEITCDPLDMLDAVN